MGVSGKLQYRRGGGLLRRLCIGVHRVYDIRSLIFPVLLPSDVGRGAGTYSPGEGIDTCS